MEIRCVPIDRINAAAYNPRVDLQPGNPELPIGSFFNISSIKFTMIALEVWRSRDEFKPAHKITRNRCFFPRTSLGTHTLAYWLKPRLI